MSPQTELQGYLSAIAECDSDTRRAELSNPTAMRDWMMMLTAWLARSAELQADAGRALNIARRDAYTALAEKWEAAGKSLAPSLAKDYIASLCSKEGHLYELAERTNRCLTHTMEVSRSLLSSLKNEMDAFRYGGAHA